MITLAYSNPDQTTQLSDNIDTIEAELNRKTEALGGVTSMDVAQSGSVVYGYNTPATGAYIFNSPGLLGSIAHGLGYAPLVIVWLQVQTYFPMPYMNVYTGGGANNGKMGYGLHYTVDSQNLNFYLDFGFVTSVGAPNGGFVFRYYIFRSPIS